MRSETFQTAAPADGGLVEVLLGALAVLTALIGLGLAADVDLMGTLFWSPPAAHPHLPSP